MNTVTVKLLELLKNNAGEISVDAVCGSLKITRRILMYNLDKINAAIAGYGIDQAFIENGILIFKAYDDSKADKLIQETIISLYVLSKNERKALLILQCALSKKNANVEELAEWLDVSRSTIVSEIAEVKDDLNQAGLQMNYSAKAGYCICGDENQIRYLLMSLYYQHILSLPKAIQKSLLTFDLSINQQAVLRESEAYIKGYYSYEAIQEISRYCALIHYRNQKNAVCIMNHDFTTYPEYQAANYIINELNKQHLYIDEREQVYLTLVLLANKLNELDSSSFETEVAKAAFDMICLFEMNGLITFNENKELMRMLMIHIRAMYYRIKYKIKIHNPHADEIIEKYYGTYSMTLAAIRKFEEDYDMTLSSDEIAYLSIYLGSFLKSSSQSEINHTDAVILVICGAGLGTSYLLKQQLTALIGKQYHYVLKDYREINEHDIEDAALTVTTLDLPFMNDKIIKVSSLLSAHQKDRIMNWNMKEIRKNQNDPLNTLLDIIERHTTIQDKEYLLNDLRSHIYEKQTRTYHLNDVMKSSYIRIVEEEYDEKDAILLTCQPLINDHVIEPGYAVELYETIEQLGMYSEYLPGILLAHANAPQYVNQVGITLTVFKQPVLFKKWGSSIPVIFTLATPNKEAHFTALDELFKLIVSDVFASIMKDLNSVTIECLNQIFKLKK